jgi:hypothetical protein
MRGLKPPGEPVEFIQGSLNEKQPWGSPQTLYGGLQRPAVSNIPRSAMPSAMSAPSEDGAEESTRTAPRINESGSMNVRDEQHYGNFVTITKAMAVVGSIQFLNAPVGKRNFLAIRNTSVTANIFLEFGKDATQDSVIRLTPNAIFLLDAVVPQDDLYMIGDAVNANFSCVFSNVTN